MDKYHDKVKAFLTENGESGVNAIANGLGVPLTTMQRYLERQTYFKKTEKRKWDLPEKVAGSIINSQSTANFETVANTINTQANMIRTHVNTALMCLDIMDSQVSIINQVAQMAIASPVASSKPTNQSLLTFSNNIDLITKAIKENSNKVNEEYRYLVKNLDVHRLCIRKGWEFMDNEFNDTLVGLLTGQIEELDSELLLLLEEFQVGHNGQNSGGTNQDKPDTQ